MENYDQKPFVNVGTGSEISISDLALLVKEIVGFEGKLLFDRSKPDGTPRKLLDVSRIHALGWKHQIDLQAGIRSVYQIYIEQNSGIER
jgi:GDP-L-fucose synthase